MMPAINFSRRFAEMVSSGEKRQTIRKAGKRKITPGDRLVFYTGQRTAACRKLGEAVCVNVEYMTIYANAELVVHNVPVGDDGTFFGLEMSDLQADALAYLDGFLTRAEMFAFFRKLYGDMFDAMCVQW
jgi:hypothetical protein